MRLTFGLFAPAAFMLLMYAAPLPAAAAETVNLATITVCSLVTSAEMSAAVGAPMTPIERSIAGIPDATAFTVDGVAVPAAMIARMVALARSRDCSWIRTPPPREGDPPLAPGQVVRVDLYVQPSSQGYFLDEKYRAGNENYTSIPGLGDDAYYTFNRLTRELRVKSGDMFIQVNFVAVNPADRQTILDAEMTIAAQVLSEL
jgi:hypothetical protein